MNLAAKPIQHWWEIQTVIFFGIAVPILPTLLAFLALWIGREIARDPRRKLTKRQNVFLNIGLVIVTFLVVTGELWNGEPLQVGWASLMGFGIGMNGLVIFELIEGFVLAWARQKTQPPADSAPPQ